MKYLLTRCTVDGSSQPKVLEAPITIDLLMSYLIGYHDLELTKSLAKDLLFEDVAYVGDKSNTYYTLESI